MGQIERKAYYTAKLEAVGRVDLPVERGSISHETGAQMLHCLHCLSIESSRAWTDSAHVRVSSNAHTGAGGRAGGRAGRPRASSYSS